MIILICGASHTGKTLLAQKILEKTKYPYLSLDHLKMGLYRSGKSKFSPLSPFKEITDEMWPIVQEIIKTNIENNQHLIIEGCFIPKNYHEYFTDNYLNQIKYGCVILSTNYLKNNVNNVIKYANIIEKRMDDNVDIDLMIRCNKEHLDNCINRNYHYYLVKKTYNIDEIVEDFTRYIGV